MGVNLALVSRAANPVHQFAMLQSVENGRHRGLAETHVLGNRADRNLTHIPDSAHDQQLGAGKPGVLAESLGMKIRGPDYPAQCHQNLLIAVHIRPPEEISDHYLYH
jgi:hypothetical protein